MACRSPCPWAANVHGGWAHSSNSMNGCGARRLCVQVWERLSADPGRQLRILDGLTHVERIACTSYSTVTRARHQGQLVVVKVRSRAAAWQACNARLPWAGRRLHIAR